MSIENVRNYFKKFKIENRIQEFDTSSATVDLAAQVLQCEPGNIAKTLSFKVNDKAILFVTAGDVKVDNRKFKDRFSTKAKMLTSDEVFSMIGHAVGGVCPFAIREGVDVYLDQSLNRFSIVYPACGSSNSGIGLTPQELEQYAQSFTAWVDVCKLR